jgi:hypothetical protein
MGNSDSSSSGGSDYPGHCTYDYNSKAFDTFLSSYGNRAEVAGSMIDVGRTDYRDCSHVEARAGVGAGDNYEGSSYPSGGGEGRSSEEDFIGKVKISDGGTPMIFCQVVDTFHTLNRWCYRPWEYTNEHGQKFMVVRPRGLDQKFRWDGTKAYAPFD